jgi:hypothetical protein
MLPWIRGETADMLGPREELQMRPGSSVPLAPMLVPRPTNFFGEKSKYSLGPKRVSCHGSGRICLPRTTNLKAVERAVTGALLLKCRHLLLLKNISG